MKKTTRAVLLYYLVLFGGFILIVAGIWIGGKYFEDLMHRYRLLTVMALFGSLIGYFRLIGYVVSTKSFEEYEKEQKKKAKINREKNRKRFKNRLIILGIYTIANVIFTVYFLFHPNPSQLGEIAAGFAVLGGVSLIAFITFTWAYFNNYKK